jgi:hypothetical protein
VEAEAVLIGLVHTMDYLEVLVVVEQEVRDQLRQQTELQILVAVVEEVLT